MNLGIDFGSSFSEFAVCSPQGVPEALQLGESGSAFVPTIACVKKKGEEILTGYGAKARISNRHYMRFKTCKMLLNAKQDEWERHDDYSVQYPPERIAKQFLSDHIAKVRAESNDEPVNNLVICVPEVWAKGVHDPDPKNTLYQICREIGIENIHIVTEPEAASAYSAYNYRKENGNTQNYNGTLLIIDYGGGTLDITLTEVDTVSDDGQDTVRITTRGRAGRGENHGGQIGVGGVAYMMRVAEYALCAALPELRSEEDHTRFKDSSAANRPEFTGFLRDLEDAIINGGDKVKKRVQAHKLNPKAMGADNDEFDWVCYGPEEEEIPVTYAMLYQAYQEIVYDDLMKSLDEIAPKVQHWVTDPYDVNQTRFKIVLVGGFGKYALVEDQVYRYFKIKSTKDNRIDKSIIGKRESAVAFGAALIADKRIMVRKTAPQSLGICGKDNATKKDTFHYAITFGQIMEHNVVYYLRKSPQIEKPNEGVFKVAMTLDNPISFAINDTDDLSKAYKYQMAPEYWRQLSSIERASGALGFRIDDSDVIELVISEYVGATRTAGRELTRIRLDSFEKLFVHSGVTFFDEDDVVYK